MYIVYKITNKINSKGYIGYTGRTLEARWKSHQSAAKQGSRFRFHSAIRKYSSENWQLEILHISENVKEIKMLEEQEIAKHGYTTKKGYNAKPGGCGGWIVQKDKYNDWRAKISLHSQGKLNANSLDITNEEIIAYGLEFIDTYGFIPGSNRLNRFVTDKGRKYPKSFAKYRFGGSHINLAKILEQMSGLVYNPYHRDEIQRQQLRVAATGKPSWQSVRKEKLAQNNQII